MTTYHIAGRGGGKTHNMLLRLGAMEDASQALVVCISNREALRVKGLFREMFPGKKPPRFTDTRQARRASEGLRGPVFVDDAHLLIENAIGLWVDHANLNGTS